MEHDGCKLCKYENCSMKSKECIGCKQNSVDKYKRMTQGDRIRSMSDEELVEFFLEKMDCAACPESEDVACEHDRCLENVKEWIQSEVEE